MRNRIPQHIVDGHKKGVEQLKFYGIPANELNRDELLAFANCLARSLKETRERLLSNLDFVRTVNLSRL